MTPEQAEQFAVALRRIGALSEHALSVERELAGMRAVVGSLNQMLGSMNYALGVLEARIADLEAAQRGPR